MRGSSRPGHLSGADPRLRAYSRSEPRFLCIGLFVEHALMFVNGTKDPVQPSVWQPASGRATSPSVALGEGVESRGGVGELLKRLRS